VLPSFLMVLALSVAYTVYGGLPWMQAMFYGVGAGVIGIMAVSASKPTRKSLGTDRWRWGYYLVAAVTVVTHTEPVLLLVGARVVQWRRVARRPRGSLRAGRWPAGGLPRGTGGSHYGARCADADFLVFDQGGRVRLRQRAGHLTVPHAGVVDEYGWLTDAQFLDAVALAMITPGPVVITVAIIGNLVAGLPGACVAALATFLPCYVLTVVPAAYFKKYGRRPAIQAFVAGITAAAIGALSGAVVVLAQRTLVDVPTVLLAVATALVLWCVKRASEPLLILVATVVGVALKL